MLVTNELHDLLESEKIYEIPSWINECSGESQQLFGDIKQIDYDSIDDGLSTLAKCLMINQFLALGVVIFTIIIGITILCCDKYDK